MCVCVGGECISENCGTLRKMEMFKKWIFISKLTIQSQFGKVSLLGIIHSLSKYPHGSSVLSTFFIHCLILLLKHPFSNGKDYVNGH